MKSTRKLFKLFIGSTLIQLQTLATQGSNAQGIFDDNVNMQLSRRDFSSTNMSSKNDLNQVFYNICQNYKMLF